MTGATGAGSVRPYTGAAGGRGAAEFPAASPVLPAGRVAGSEFDGAYGGDGGRYSGAAAQSGLDSSRGYGGGGFGGGGASSSAVAAAQAAAAAAAQAAAAQAVASAVAASAAAAQPEELFCVCRRPATGGMIACDNDKCKTPSEWYHYECVGVGPDGLREDQTWQCPPCNRQAGRAAASAMDAQQAQQAAQAQALVAQQRVAAAHHASGQQLPAPVYVPPKGAGGGKAGKKK
jgi:hypothetical protein